MSTLPNPTPAGYSAGGFWRPCARCGGLFPAAPDEHHCHPAAPPGPAGPAGLRGWCPAAHPEDGSPCDGPADAVRVVDQLGEHRYGCVRHAAVALASIEHARVYPGSRPGAACQAYTRARQLRPFAFHPPAEPRPVRGDSRGPGGPGRSGGGW